MSSTTPLSNITNNSSDAPRAPRINTVDLPEVDTASFMQGAPSPHITPRDISGWFEGIPETTWGTPVFQPTSNSLGLELLANAATRMQEDNSPPSPTVTHQERRANLQQFGEPPLRWRPEYGRSWQHPIDPEWTLEDLTSWPQEAPAYQERPRTNERTIMRASWDPYPTSRADRFSYNDLRSEVRPRRGRANDPTRPMARRSDNGPPRRHINIRSVTHKRRAMEYIGLAPLPHTYDEYYSLHFGQKLKVAYLFSVENSIIPYGETSLNIQYWKRTVLQEWDEELSNSFRDRCEDCNLTRGPWCF